MAAEQVTGAQLIDNFLEKLPGHVSLINKSRRQVEVPNHRHRQGDVMRNKDIHGAASQQSLSILASRLLRVPPIFLAGSVAGVDAKGTTDWSDRQPLHNRTAATGKDTDVRTPGGQPVTFCFELQECGPVVMVAARKIEGLAMLFQDVIHAIGVLWPVAAWEVESVIPDVDQ
ncbi:hypothetical protein M1D93_13250 [Arthrobacter sp. Z1-9]